MLRGIILGQVSPAEEGVTMVEVVMVIAPRIFRDEEYTEPKRVLESRGAHVVTASVAPGECIGKLGLHAVAELSVTEATQMAWDAVIFV